MITASEPATAEPGGRRLGELLELARWAPSGDNRQPWRVRPVAGGVQIAIDDQDVGFLDEGPAICIALGAFAESCQLAAAQLGIPASVHPAGGPEQAAPGAFLALGQTRAAGARGGLGALLPRRSSNRRRYAPGSCTAGELRQIAGECASIEGVQLSFVSGRGIERLSRAIALAEKVRLRHRRCHREFHAKVRWSTLEAQRDPTGFWVDTFELQSHERWVLRATRAWPVFRAADALFRIGTLAAQVARRQVCHSGAVAMFRLGELSPRGWIDVGRALQRAWLRATALGLSGQVLGVAPILLQRLRGGGAGLSARQRRQVHRVGELLSTVPDAPPPTELALMLRLGRAAPPTARAGRLQATALVVPAGCDR